MAKQKVPEIRVVKRTRYGPYAKQAGDPWFEVQYYSKKSDRWRGYRQWGSTLEFKNKSEALDFALRKKAGVPTNNTVTEVVA